jgi:mono/diheme cytochrome c family protein
MARLFLYTVLIGLVCVKVQVAWTADLEVLRPRVPPDQLDAARALHNPFQPTPEAIAKGKAIFEGKGFCKACHGADGKGFPKDLDLKGPLPRDFTDSQWQAVRTDGELFWILKNGSPGTDMAPFVPLVLTEEEAWHVILYVRSLNGR